ncbi:MAG TPA: FHA domain-containing protein, partial [Rhodanobacteraceae bacterium]|nr:FHA domain-containing protein [Rhodanobacteraceae bacterium]
DEISRRHARIRPANGGVLVEDLDSANGTYINGKRIRNGLLHPGEELALDAVRFMLLAPGAEVVVPAATPAEPMDERGGNGLRWAISIIAVLILAAVATYFAGLW